ncbi:MAG: hypothetical protein ACE5JH_05790 [Acidobacteriota bacterium]
MRTTLRLLAATAAVAFSLGAAPAPARRGAAPPPAPLTNEDVVRLVMTGTEQKAILALIGRRPVDFDLDPDIVVELRAAGVGETIIEAMRRRQAAMPPSAPAPAPAGPAAGTLEIVLLGGPEGGDAPAAIAVRSLPESMGRPGGMEVGVVDDLALLVLCTTPDHVPDHWDARSPLAGAPRHAVLLFRPGSRARKGKGFGLLHLDLEPSYSIPVPAGRHAVSVVAAGRHVGSGDWRILAADDARVAVPPGGTARLGLRAGGRLAGNRTSGFRVENRWEIVPLESGAAEAAP